MKAEVSQEAVTEVDPATKAFADTLGMSLLQNLHEEVRQLHENQHSIQQELRELRGNLLSGSDFLIVRAWTLDDWASNRDFDSEDVRNDLLVHRGNIQSDVDTIRYFASPEPERVEKWKAVFQKFYGMLFECVDPVINMFADVLIDVMNKRAGVHWLKKWRWPSNQDRLLTILNIANDFIRCFCEKGSTGVTDEEMTAKLEILKEAWLLGMAQATEEIKFSEEMVDQYC